MKEENESLIEQAEQYVKTTTDLYTLKIADKVSTVVSSLVARLVIGSFAFIAVFMITMALSFWLGYLLGNEFYGFLILGSASALIGVVLYMNRTKWIKKPLTETIISQILN